MAWSKMTWGVKDIDFHDVIIAQPTESHCTELAMTYTARQLGIPHSLHVSSLAYTLLSAMLPGEVALQKQFSNVIGATTFCAAEVYGFDPQCHQALFPL